MKKNLALLLLLLSCPFFLCSCACLCAGKLTSYPAPDGPRYAKLMAVKPEEVQKKAAFKVVSYNIGLCKNILQIGSFLAQTTGLAGADIICLQEMNIQDLEWLAQTLNYNYVYYPVAVHPENNRDFGQAILSKWPIQDTQKVLLPFSSNDRYLKIQRCAVGAKLSVNGQTLWVFSVHLGVIISPQHRKEQLLAVTRTLSGNADNCIIAGDFNTYGQIHTQAIEEVMRQEGFKLATQNSGWTYKYWYLLNHRAVLDYIFYRGLKLIQSGKVNDRRYSDHLPVWADFSIQAIGQIN